MPDKASSEELTKLKATLDGALAGLENVEPKRLFGCDGWFAQGNIFALVWKEGRLGYRLSEPLLYAEAMGIPGAEAWAIDGKVMRHWVLLPSAWHRDPAKLKVWGRKAHALASARPEKLKVTRKAGAAKTVKPAVFKKVSKLGRG
jgi:TfoX/Sxy family transcriptional regulator of competence genes